MFEVQKVRYFRNSRDMVGFVASIYKDGDKVGECRHDGDALLYSVSLDASVREEFVSWAESIAHLTIWNPEEFAQTGESNRRGLVETAGVEYMLSAYEKAYLGAQA